MISLWICIPISSNWWMSKHYMVYSYNRILLRHKGKKLMYIYLRWNTKWLVELTTFVLFCLQFQDTKQKTVDTKQKTCQWCPSDGKEMRWALCFLQPSTLRRIPEGRAGRETSVRTPWALWGKETKPRVQGEKAKGWLLERWEIL